ALQKMDRDLASDTRLATSVESDLKSNDPNRLAGLTRTLQNIHTPGVPAEHEKPSHRQVEHQNKAIEKKMGLTSAEGAAFQAQLDDAPILKSIIKTHKKDLAENPAFDKFLHTLGDRAKEDPDFVHQVELGLPAKPNTVTNFHTLLNSKDPQKLDAAANLLH